MSFWQREKEKDSCPTTTYNISNKTAWYPKEMIFPSSLSAFHLPFIHQSLRWHFMVNVPSFYFHALPLCTTNLLIIFLPDKKNSLNILWTSEIICCTKCCKQVIRKKKTLKKLKEEKKSGRRCMTSRFSATGKQSHWQHWQLFPFCRERRRTF